ncbi:MAG TPA: FAD-binding oxidoreductase [Victivallales bacterium]|nr:FAD-binding oxidoreductase [Victivallales bacterium]
MQKYVGCIAIILLLIIDVLLWMFFPPPYNGTRFFVKQLVAEIFASIALILLSCNIFLAMKIKKLEPYFGGLDKIYLAHRKIAIWAIIFLICHFSIIPDISGSKTGTDLGLIAFWGIIALSFFALSNRLHHWLTNIKKNIFLHLPQKKVLIKLDEFLTELFLLTFSIVNIFNKNYFLWRFFHRFMGVIFIIAIIHLFLVNALIHNTKIVYYYVLAVSILASLGYIYKEVFSGIFNKKIIYKVTDLNKFTNDIVEITLSPKDKILNYIAGQFLYISFKHKPLLKKAHPFSICSSPQENDLRITVRNVGKFTSYLYRNLQKGTNAHVEGGYGMFNYKSGRKNQLWIAGGIGITPFMSWVRDFQNDRHFNITLYHTIRTATDGLFAEEIKNIAEDNNNFEAIFIHTQENGRLNVDKILKNGITIDDKEIYMCGPGSMISSFKKQFIRRGVPSDCIHYEEFDFR